MSTTAHHKLPSGSLSTASHRQLVAYFRSGWAFLIPYLAAYLLYAWLKWPVNPASGGEGLVKGMSESAGALPLLRLPSSVYRPPCLLHVYWFLHALHLMLGALALRAWWQGSILKLQLPTSSPTFYAYSRTRTSAEPRDVSKHQQGTGAHSARPPSTVHRAAQPLLSTVSLSDNRPPSTGSGQACLSH